MTAQPNVDGSGSWGYNIMPYIELMNVYMSTTGFTVYDTTSTHIHDKTLQVFLCPTRQRKGFKTDNSSSHASAASPRWVKPTARSSSTIMPITRPRSEPFSPRRAQS